MGHHTADIAMDTADIAVINSRGESVPLTGIAFNAAISALELRTSRNADGPPALLAMVGESPLRVVRVALGGDRRDMAIVNFETATLACSFECNTAPRRGDDDRSPGGVFEVVVLRGLRIESKE